MSEAADVGLADFVLPLIRRRRLIAGLVAVVAVASVIAALVWPKSWRASATLLPPERRMDNPLFVPGGFEGLGASLRGISLRHVATPSDIFVAILESRNVAEALVERFGLQEEYDVRSLTKAVKRLQSESEVTVTREGTIRVSATAGSAELAADLANAFVEELDRVNRTLANQEAVAIREFVEKELAESKDRLSAAEDELRSFQETHGAVEVTEQARAVIAAAAAIRAQILTAEVDLGVLLRTRDESHPEVQRARDYLAELRLRLAEIEGEDESALAGGTQAGPVEPTAPPEPETAEPEVFPPLSKMPSLGLRYGRLLREVKTEEAVVALLTEQYHRARIEERRSLPTVRVLDAAVPPERRYRPRRTMLVLLCTGLAFVAAVGLAYSLEIVDRIRRDPVRYAPLHRLAGDLRKGIRS